MGPQNLVSSISVALSPETINQISRALVNWLLEHGIKIVVILIAALVVVKLGKIFIARIVRRVIKEQEGVLTKEAEEKREDTLIGIFGGILTIVVWVGAIFAILSEFGIDIGGLIVGAGVIGVALGFGAQYVIRDFLAGIFIILENQYRIGDVVCFGKTCGTVEDITLRKTVLRDRDGIQHHIPNGEIKTASNMSKEFARINLNVGIAYNSDLEKVIEIVNRVGKELAQDSEWREAILEPPQFLRVDDFGDSAVIIRIIGKTAPLKQWAVTGELRKRLKIAFDREEIEIPFPQMSVWPKGEFGK